MNTTDTSTGQSTAKFKTTLYLTEDNRKRLHLLTKGNRTKLINQAIAEKLEALEKEQLKEKLLKSLEKANTSTSSTNTSTEDALNEIRKKELSNLISNS